MFQTKYRGTRPIGSRKAYIILTHEASHLTEHEANDEVASTAPSKGICGFSRRFGAEADALARCGTWIGQRGAVGV